MKLSCIHCGKDFTITAEQLGGRGRCPHCQGEIQLPKPEDDRPGGMAPVATSPFHWLENSISALGSMVLHMVLLLVLALVQFNSGSGEGMGEEVLIGTLPSTQLSTAQEEELKADEVQKDKQSNELDESLEVEPPLMSTDDPTLSAELALSSPSPSGGESSSFDVGAVSSGGGSMAGGSWDGMLQNLRRNGLEIVITFDSTGSMSGEINQVKQQIKRIGSTLITMVPKARISICTYRDEGDEYVVRGLPLTGDIQQVDTYLSNIRAGGGGDHPEAVHEGLRWSVDKNQFNPRARKIILIFGDAPPHQEYQRTCLRIASDFSSQQKGVVSTVTCRGNERLPEFIEIAQMGGGEAFLASDERQIMTQLLVLVFGSQYRSKVLEAFKLLDR
jgi:DNA-directed RNA polymerase subunit RPC12/RpoP